MTNGIELFHFANTIIDVQTFEVSSPVLNTLSQTTFENNIDISWNSINHAVGYNVYLNNVKVQTITGSTTNTNVNLQESNQKNVISVSAYNYFMESPKSDAINIKTIRQIPNQVSFITTNQSTDNKDFEIVWNQEIYAEGYYVICNDSEIREYNLYTSTSATSIFEDNLNANYIYEIIAFNRYGNASSSPKINITLCQLPSQPILISTNTTLVNEQVFVLNIQNQINTDNFSIYLNNTYFKTINQNYCSILLNNENCSFEISVYAHNQYGSSLISKSIKIQSLRYAPLIPKWISSNQTTNGSFSLLWEASEYSIGYIILRNGTIYNQTTDPEITYSFMEEGDWEFKIGAFNNFATTYSEPCLIHVKWWLPYTPRFENISTTILTTNFTIAYTSENATIYHLFLNGQYFNSTSESNYTFEMPFENAEYSITIIAENSYGNSSNSLPLVIRTIIACPNSTSIFGNMLTTSRLYLNWSMQEWTDNYELYIDGNLNQTLSTSINNTTIDFPLVNATYSITLKARNTMGLSNESNVLSFDVVVYLPEVPRILTTNQTLYINDVSTLIPITLTWEESSYATLYQIEVNGEMLATTDLTSFDLSLSQGNYTIRVIAINEVGRSLPSNEFGVSIILTTPSSPDAPFEMPDWSWWVIGGGSVVVIGGIVYYLKKRD